ncbi:UNVERIFIED_CONTAM: hypothetical protein FKN15_013259 [Acipenser sinensis]
MEHRIKLEPGCEKEKRFAAANRQLSADVVVKMSDWQALEEQTRGELKPERAAQRFRDEPAMERGCREKPMVERRLPTKLPSFDGTSSWEAFNAQMGVMEKLCGWTPEEKAQQLTAALRGEAQMRTYTDSPAREQEEQVRFQFVEAVGPGELRKHLRLSKPRSLQEAFQLAQEWEDISKEEDEHRSQPAVRATEVEVGPEQSGLGLAEVMEEIVAIRKAMAARPPPFPQSGPHLCWECGQPGHIRVDCWRRWRRADHPAVLAPNPARPAGNGIGSA